MKNKNLFIIIIVLLGIFFGLIFLTPKKIQLVPGKLQVTTSFYPLYYFAHMIGGDKVQVVNITPSGAEPHDYEPTAQDIARIEDSTLLILNGGNLEPWGNDITQNIDPTKTTIVTVGENLITQTVAENGKNNSDPHIWLSPYLAGQIVDKITTSFISADPQNATVYQSNATVLKNNLTQLDAEYKKGLSMCASKDIVTSHAAFGYLATEFGLTQIPIAGLSPDTEPSPKDMVAVAEFAKSNNVKYIFFESLVSPKLSATIATEIGAQTMVLDPIEGLTANEVAAGSDYLTLMQNNLRNLRIALSCK